MCGHGAPNQNGDLPYFPQLYLNCSFAGNWGTHIRLGSAVSPSHKIVTEFILIWGGFFPFSTKVFKYPLCSIFVECNTAFKTSWFVIGLPCVPSLGKLCYALGRICCQNQTFLGRGRFFRQMTRLGLNNSFLRCSILSRGIESPPFVGCRCDTYAPPFSRRGREGGLRLSFSSGFVLPASRKYSWKCQNYWKMMHQ